MANQSKRKVKSGKKKKSRAITMAVVPRGLRLDEAAAKYANLIADPCGGPLVAGPFGDGGGGLISRFEVDFLADYTATSTCSSLGFIPGIASGYTATIPVVTDTTAFAFAGSVGISPGLAFLTANASAFRCLAACIQVYYPGSELSRAGITSVGQFSAAAVSLTATNTTSSLRSAATYVERVPDQMVELIWRPTNYDLEWFGTGTTEGSVLTDKRSALITTTAGIPVSTGMRYRLVAVYEWMPIPTEGFVMPHKTSNESSNTFQDVIKKLDSFGDWMYHGALSAGQAASKVYAGVRAVGQVAYGTTKMAAMLMG